jgi:hypothetical protein
MHTMLRITLPYMFKARNDKIVILFKINNGNDYLNKQALSFSI